MNMGGVHRSEMTAIGQRAEMVAADRQGRNAAVMPPWVAGWNAKVFRSVMGGKPVAGITSVGNDDAHRWKDSVQSPAEMRLWMLECIAHGMRPWVVKFCGTLYDRRWMPAGRRSLQLARRERDDSCANAAIWRASASSGRRRPRPPSATPRPKPARLGIYQCARRSADSV